METQTIISTILPVSLGFMMFSLGISLTVQDFRRVLVYPKPIFIGLFIQSIFLPAIAFFLCKAFKLSPDFSIGLMLLAASPGGSLANIFSHFSGGDVALNLTLTAVNAITAIFFLPFIVGLSIQHFAGEGQAIGMQFGKTVEVFSIVLIPVALGMILQKKSPGLAEKLQTPLKKISAVLLAVITVGAIIKERELLQTSAAALGIVMLTFNLFSMGVGYVIPRTLRMSRPQSISICMELGIHNAAMAMTIAVTVLDRISYGLPSAVYAVIMLITASILSYLFRRRTPTGV